VAVMEDLVVKRPLSTGRLSVDGALIDAWVSMKSVRRQDGGDDPPSGPGRNAEPDFRGERRSDATHTATTDPDAQLHRRSKGPSVAAVLRGALADRELERPDRRYPYDVGGGTCQMRRY